MCTYRRVNAIINTLFDNAAHAHAERTADGHLEGVVEEANFQYGTRGDLSKVEL